MFLREKRRSIHHSIYIYIIYTTAKTSTHTQNTVNRKYEGVTELGSAWVWTWLKALISPWKKTN